MKTPSICKKTCSSLVKIISDGESNFIQNKIYNKWMKHRKVLRNDKNANMGSSKVSLHRVDFIYIDMQIQD